jgi:hypothetical protein
MIKITAIAAAALLSTCSAFASTNLVVDGSFEDQAQGLGTWNVYSSIDGWTATTGGIEVRNSVAGTAENGVNFVELDANFNSVMDQTVATVDGQAYQLSFWYSSRPVSPDNGAFPGLIVPAGSNGLSYDVGAGDVSVYAPTANTDLDNDWTLYTTTFIATGSTTTLTFSATGTSDSFGTSLDNVILTAVPEPGELSLMATGLVLLAGLARRRQRRS